MVAITAILNTYLFLPVTEPTYSNNKMTSYEMKNRFTRICLFVTKKVFKKSAGLQVALSLSLSLYLPSSDRFLVRMLASIGM